MAESDKIVTAYDYINMWYEKSGENNDFHPNIIILSNFSDIWSCWSGLDTLDRCLWHETNTGPGKLHEMDVTSMFGVTPILTSDEYFTGSWSYGVTKNQGTPNQLIKKSELSDFNLGQIKMNNCRVYLPSSLEAQIQVNVSFRNSSWTGMDMDINTPWLIVVYGPGVTTTVTQSSDVYMLKPEMETNGSMLVISETVKSQRYSGITGRTITGYITIDGNMIDVTMDVKQVDSGSTGYTSLIMGVATFNKPLTGVTTIEEIKLPEHLYEYNSPTVTPPAATYIELPWYVYNLAVGIGKTIPLSTNMSSCNPYGGYGDFISLSGGYDIIKDIPFTTGLTSGQKVIKINTNYVEDYIGQYGYFRVPFSVGSTSDIAFYLCFRCTIYSDELRPDTAEDGGCRIWLTNDTAITLSTMGNLPINERLTFTSHNNFFENTFTIEGSGGFMALTNYFSDAVVSFNSNQMSTARAFYNSNNTSSIDQKFFNNNFISFISPSCNTLQDVKNYLHNSPSVELYITA